MMKKITTIIETHQVRIIRRSGKQVHVWCDACADAVRMFRPEIFARLTKSSVQSVYRRIEAGQLHFAEMPDGSLLICANSLANAIVTTTSAPAGAQSLRPLPPAESLTEIQDDRDASDKGR